MIRAKRLTFTFIVLLYSAGFVALEMILQHHRCSSSTIAVIACSHNIVSTFLAAYIFSKFIKTNSKYLWVIGFVAVGIADIFHAVFLYVFPLTPEALALVLSDKLYILFAAMQCVALYLYFKSRIKRDEVAVIILLSLFYCSLMIFKISIPYWKNTQPLTEILAEGIYDVVTALFVAILIIKGLTARYAIGFLFYTSYILIFFSDFAIRYYDSVMLTPTLVLFNYGWEMGFALIAMMALWIRVNDIPIENLFDTLPFKSIRFYVAGLSFMALAVFATSSIFIGTDISRMRGVDVSVILLLFLLSWTIANAASLWMSSHMLRLKKTVIGDSSCLNSLNVEVADLVEVYRLKNMRIVKAMNVIKQQRSEREKSFRYIAHDMRSPISVLKCYIATNKSDDGDCANDFKEAAQCSVQKLVRMADDLVDYAKSSTIERKYHSLRTSICNAVILETKRDASLKGVKVMCDLNEDVLANIDGYKFERVLINLVNNAIQASGEGGTVLLSTAVTDDGMLIIKVEDEGKGIEHDHMPHVFDAFFTKEKIGGTGLGLAYCKQVVEAHGGTISVESDVGKGTIFTVRIPDCVVSASSERAV